MGSFAVILGPASSPEQRKLAALLRELGYSCDTFDSSHPDYARSLVPSFYAYVFDFSDGQTMRGPRDAS